MQEIWANLGIWWFSRIRQLPETLKILCLSSSQLLTSERRVVHTTRECSGIVLTGVQSTSLPRCHRPFQLRIRDKSIWIWWRGIRVVSTSDYPSLNLIVQCVVILHCPLSISLYKPHQNELLFLHLIRNWSWATRNMSIKENWPSSQTMYKFKTRTAAFAKTWIPRLKSMALQLNSYRRKFQNQNPNWETRWTVPHKLFVNPKKILFVS